jgi:hypothetical protein
MTDRELLKQFVASFAKLDDLSSTRELDPTAWELRVAEPDQDGWIEWQPAETTADHGLLDLLYSKLPSRFPPLYETLVLSYRWACVYLPSFSLLANPPGPDLNGLLKEITRDKGLWESLAPAGYLQFGRGPDMDYDPVCFDIKSRTKRKECRIVKIDHEEILCNYRVKVVAELAPSFEHLVRQTIERGNSLSK